MATGVEQVEQYSTKASLRPRSLTQLGPASIQRRGRASGGSEPPSPPSSCMSWRRSSTLPTTLMSTSATSWQPGSTSQKLGYRYSHPCPRPPTSMHLGPWVRSHVSCTLWGFPIKNFPLALSHEYSYIGQISFSRKWGHHSYKMVSHLGGWTRR